MRTEPSGRRGELGHLLVLPSNQTGTQNLSAPGSRLSRLQIAGPGADDARDRMSPYPCSICLPTCPPPPTTSYCFSPARPMTLSLPPTPLPPPWSLQSLPEAALSALKTPFLGCERGAPLSRAGPHPEGHLPAASGCEPPTRLAALPAAAQPLQLLPRQPCRRERVVPGLPGLQPPYQEPQTHSVTLEFKPHDWAWVEGEEQSIHTAILPSV